ncbi:MAG: TonB-dependent receptor [Rhodospirillaceae bacterium]
MKTRNWIAASLMASVALPAGHGALAQNIALEEIVVTARKRDENIFEIPVSVTALSQDQIDRAGIYNAEDLSTQVAGLDFQGSTATGGRNNPSIRFRGMNQQIITPSTQIGALFWDGSYIGGGGAFLPFGDLERVEVIKGPQTAFFGRNTFSGAVNLIPKKPTDEWEGDIDLEWSPSQSDEYKIEGAIGGPLGEKAGVRVWVGYSRDGGDYRTQADDEAYAVFKDTSVQGTFTMDPSEDLRLEFTGYYTRATDNGTSGSVNANGPDGVPPGACGKVFNGQTLNPVTGERNPLVTPIANFGGWNFCGDFPNGKNWVAPFTTHPTGANTFGGQARLDAQGQLYPLMDRYGILRKPTVGEYQGLGQSYRLQFKGEYDLGDHVATVQVSRSNTGTNDRRDFFFGSPPFGGALGTTIIVGADIALRDTYYEARIASPQDQKLRYMVGVSDYTQRYRVTTSSIDFQDNTTLGIFGSVDYDVTDDLTASLELRYTDEESETIIQGRLFQGWTGSGDTNCPVTTACNSVNEYDDFIPRAILSYTPIDGATLYGSYSASSLLGVATQAGSISAVAPSVIPPDQVDALGIYTGTQKNTQFELGWKQQTETLNWTLALFHIDWKNQPFASVIVLPTGGTTSYRGPGDSKYKGFDLDFTWAPNDVFSLAGNIGYTDAVLSSFSSRGSSEQRVLGSGSLSVVADGNKPRNIPAFTGTLTPTISGVVGDRQWYIRADIAYESRSWADYSRYLHAPDRFGLNARLGFDLYEGARMELFGKNLTNNSTLTLSGGTTGFISLDRKAYSEPPSRREIGVRLTAEF